MTTVTIRTYTSVLLGAVCLSLLAQNAQSQDYPPAFPREGARQVFDNMWITAWDDTWIPDKPTPMHRHVYDYFGWEFTDSKTDSVSPEGDTRSVSTSRGLAWFLSKGVTHVEIGRSSNPPRHAILVELKDAGSPYYRNTTTFPTAFPSDGDRQIVDNQRVTMWERTWMPGQPASPRYFERNVVMIFANAGDLRLGAPVEQPHVTSFAEGAVLFLAGGGARAIEATNIAVRTLLVELK